MRKLILLLISFIITGLVQGQESDPFNFTFNHIALSVKDIDRSSEFYTNVLNMREITNRTKTDGIRWFLSEKIKNCI